MANDRPSKKQNELLRFIDGFIKGNGYGPSYREIMRALNYKSVSTVAVHIDGLIAKGQLIKHGRSARSLEVAGSEPTPKTAKSSNEQWLLEQTMLRIELYKESPNDERADTVESLLKTLQILGFTEAEKQARAAYTN